MIKYNHFVLRVVLSVISILFGVATVIEGGSVLFVDGSARVAAGNYAPFIVWFNFFAGFFYIATGIGIFKSRPWARSLAISIAASTLAFFALFGFHVLLGRPYEARTVLAMTLRSGIWCGIALMLYSKRVRGGLSAGVFALAVLAHSPSLFASESEPPEMPEGLSVGGTQLRLNGKVVHKVTFLKIKAFAAGLYLEARSKDYVELTKSPRIKHFRVRFLRSVSRERLAKTWKKQLHESCQRRCDELSSPTARLGDAFEDLNSGDLLEFTIYPDRLSISVKGRPKDSIPSVALAEAMLDAWIGPEPIAEDVKAALLGEPN